MDLSPGTTLSHYRIASRIGRGGMGKVYLAQDMKLDHKVVLKILPKDLAIDAAHAFTDEGVRAPSVKSPQIGALRTEVN